MNANVKSYLLAVLAVGMLIAMLQVMLKESAVKRAVMLSAGIVLTLTVCMPLVRADISSFSQYLAKIDLQTDALTSGIEVKNRDLLGSIIQEKTEAYISDKGAELGCDLCAAVEIAYDAEYPYPYAVTVIGALSEEEWELLSSDLEQSLGIPKERQALRYD